jgi:hypothetical protein
MTLKIVNLPLYSDSYYTYALALQGVSYNLEFIYNERCGLYFLNFLNSDSVPIVEGIALTPSYPILLDYALEPLTGWLWLEEKSTNLFEPYKLYPDKIDQYYTLKYSYVS